MDLLDTGYWIRYTKIEEGKCLDQTTENIMSCGR